MGPEAKLTRKNSRYIESVQTLDDVAFPYNGKERSKSFESQETHDFEKLLTNVFKLSIQHLKENEDRDQKVVKFIQPDDLRKAFDFTLPEKATNVTELVDIVKQVLERSVRTSHPRFYNQLFAGIDPVALAGDWVTSVLNTCVYTYEVAPVFTLMELEVASNVRQLIGYPTGDGMFCPGGSISNLYAIMAARYQRFPSVKTEGLWGLPRMVMFVSEECHYSFTKACTSLGMGTRRVVPVKADKMHKMDVADLERKIKEALERGEV
eukprot:Colp12_sorted_trinity150504_noHs@8985